MGLLSLWARMKLKERVTIGIVASLTGDHHGVDGGISIRDVLYVEANLSHNRGDSIEENFVL